MLDPSMTPNRPLAFPPHEQWRIGLFLGLSFFCLAVMHYPHHASTLWMYRLGTFLGIAEPWMADAAAGVVCVVAAGVTWLRNRPK